MIVWNTINTVQVEILARVKARLRVFYPKN